MQTLAALPRHHDPNVLARRSATAGIGLDPLTRYQLTPESPAHPLVIGYGNVTPHGIDQAIAALGGLLDTTPRR